MQSRVGGRRAAPPRPTLLVGDLSACHAAFERMQQRVLELSLAQQALADDPPSSAVDAWRDLVPRCRALRETLTSLRELTTHFAREVYECAADVCARAHDWPEALKALQQLVKLVYPALAAQQQQQQDKAMPAGPPGLTLSTAAAGGMGGGGPPRWAEAGDEASDDEACGAAAVLDGGAVAAALACREFRRWPEVAAATVLYFACLQPQQADRLDTHATLRRLPQGLLGAGAVQLALRLHAALAAGDFVSLLRLRAAAPLLVRLVTAPAAQRARERALAVLAVAYRSIALAGVCSMLQLAGGERQLLTYLKLLADRGHLAAQRALDTLQQEEPGAATKLVVFKG